jgi:hypothetical protein
MFPHARHRCEAHAVCITTGTDTVPGTRKEHPMTIAAVWHFEGNTPEEYEQVFTLGGSAINNQPARLSHVCYITDTGIDVVDVWADEASFIAFGAIIGPATVQAGLLAPPAIYPVQGHMANDGVRNP